MLLQRKNYKCLRTNNPPEVAGSLKLRSTDINRLCNGAGALWTEQGGEGGCEWFPRDKTIKHLLVSMSPLSKRRGGVKLSKNRIKKILLKSSLRGILEPLWQGSCLCEMILSGAWQRLSAVSSPLGRCLWSSSPPLGSFHGLVLHGFVLFPAWTRQQGRGSRSVPLCKAGNGRERQSRGESPLTARGETWSNS